jgi:hypothetical protein
LDVRLEGEVATLRKRCGTALRVDRLAIRMANSAVGEFERRILEEVEAGARNADKEGQAGDWCVEEGARLGEKMGIDGLQIAEERGIDRRAGRAVDEFDDFGIRWVNGI